MTEFTKDPARRGRRSVLFGRVGPPHAAGEAPAPRPRLGRLRPAAPRAAAAGSWPRASGRAPAGMLPGRRRAPRVCARPDSLDSSTPRPRRSPRAPAAAAARARRARRAFPHSAAGLRLRQAVRGAAARPGEGRLRRKNLAGRGSRSGGAWRCPQSPREGPGSLPRGDAPRASTRPRASRLLSLPQPYLSGDSLSALTGS